MPIKFTCPSCGKALKVPDEAALGGPGKPGKQGRCPQCQSTVTVPSSARPPEDEEKIEIAEREKTKFFKTEETIEGLRRCPGCRILVEKTARVCPRCGADLTKAPEAPKSVSPRRLPRQKPELHPPSFWAALPHAFGYPFNLKGIFILILGTVLIVIVGIIQFIVLFAGLMGMIAQIIIAVFTVGYVGSYMFRIISETGGGEDNPPSLPGLADYVEDIIIPFGQLLATFLVAAAPLLIYWLACFIFRIPSQKIVSLVLFIYALIYIPMGLTAVAMFGSASALNPLLVIGSIFKVPLHYLGALVFLGLSSVVQFLSKMAVLPQVPVLSAILSIFISLYFLMVNMRVLGLIYRYDEEKLGWI
jgi:hypothetical protein